MLFCLNILICSPQLALADAGTPVIDSISNNGSIFTNPNNTYVTLPEYQVQNVNLSETNELATVICQFIALMQGGQAQVLVAAAIVAMGVNAFMGKVSIALVVTFAIGTAIFFGSSSIINLFVPYANISQGCNCVSDIILGQNGQGGYALMQTGLNSDCTTTTTSSTDSSQM